MRAVNQRGRRRVAVERGLSTLRIPFAAPRRVKARHVWSGVKPHQPTGVAKGHHLATWRRQGRQALVREALRLGVLTQGVTPYYIGAVGEGQFRSWRSLACAIERAQAAEKVREFVDSAQRLSAEIGSALADLGARATDAGRDLAAMSTRPAP